MIKNKPINIQAIILQNIGENIIKKVPNLKNT